MFIQTGGRERFFIRKNGKNEEAINHIGIKDYSHRVVKASWADYGDYYLLTPSSIPWSGVPEPTTYGAIFGAVGLCLVTFRRRVRAYRRSLAGRRSDVTSSFPRGAPTASLPKARL